MHIKFLLYFCLLGIVSARQRHRSSRFRKTTTEAPNDSSSSHSEAEDSSIEAADQVPQYVDGTSANSEPSYQGNFIPVPIDSNLRNYYQQLLAPPVYQTSAPTAYPTSAPLLNPYAINPYYQASPNNAPIPVLVKSQNLNYFPPNINRAPDSNAYANNPYLNNPYAAYPGANLARPQQLIPIPVIFNEPNANTARPPTNPYLTAQNDYVPSPQGYQPIPIPVHMPANSQYQSQLQSPLLNYVLVPVQQSQASQSPNEYQIPSKNDQNSASSINYSAPSNVLRFSQLSAPPSDSSSQSDSYARTIEYITSLLKANSGREPHVYMGTTPAPVTPRPNGAYTPSTEVSRVSYTSSASNYNY